MLSQILTLFVSFTTIGGGLWMVFGAIVTGLGLKDQNGPQIQSGIWQLVGGGLIVAAAQLFSTIAV